MKSFVNPCINGLIKLIDGQIDEVVEKQNRRVKVLNRKDEHSNAC